MKIVNAAGERICFALAEIADEVIAYQHGHIFVGEEDFGAFSLKAYDDLMDAIAAVNTTKDDWDDDL